MHSGCAEFNYQCTEYLITRDEKLNSVCETVSNTTGSVALVDGSIACLCRVNSERAVAGGGREMVAACSVRRDGIPTLTLESYQADSKEVRQAHQTTTCTQSFLTPLTYSLHWWVSLYPSCGMFCKLLLKKKHFEQMMLFCLI